MSARPSTYDKYVAMSEMRDDARDVQQEQNACETCEWACWFDEGYGSDNFRRLIEASGVRVGFCSVDNDDYAITSEDSQGSVGCSEYARL